MSPSVSRDADQALAALIDELDEQLQQLLRARQRAFDVQQWRREGQSWSAIVASENRPLIVEQVSCALASLARAGSVWRRQQARALRSDGATVAEIAALFGVSRQRVYTLLSGHDTPAD